MVAFISLPTTPLGLGMDAMASNTTRETQIEAVRERGKEKVRNAAGGRPVVLAGLAITPVTTVRGSVISSGLGPEWELVVNGWRRTNRSNRVRSGRWRWHYNRTSARPRAPAISFGLVRPARSLNTNPSIMGPFLFGSGCQSCNVIFHVCRIHRAGRGGLIVIHGFVGSISDVVRLTGEKT